MAKIAKYSYLSNLSADALSAVYRSTGADYPKFFKMDALCKAGFLLAEDIVRGCGNPPLAPDDTSVVVFTASGTYLTDVAFENTISDPDNCFPSPSVFVYSLPNIVAGEIAIRHGFISETAVYLSPDFSPSQIADIVSDTLSVASNVLVSWIEVTGNHPSAIMFLVSRNGNDDMLDFNAENLEDIYKRCFE